MAIKFLAVSFSAASNTECHTPCVTLKELMVIKEKPKTTIIP